MSSHLGKRRLDIADVGGQARVADEPLDEIGRFALSAQRLEIPADELLAFVDVKFVTTPPCWSASSSTGMLDSARTRSPSDDAGKSKEIQRPEGRELQVSANSTCRRRSGSCIAAARRFRSSRRSSTPCCCSCATPNGLARREELIETLWPDTHVSDANLTNVIVTLRKVLGRASIQTVSKFGYRFCLPVLGEPGIHQGTYATFLQAKELVTVRSFGIDGPRARSARALRRRGPDVCCRVGVASVAVAGFWRSSKPDRRSTSRLAQAALRRALAIDPHLACAHHFYTQLQIDLGESRVAAVRLVQRIVARGADPESFAGLVQALRYCGLLEESPLRAPAGDRRSIRRFVTSVPHTHFLRCDYHATLRRRTAAPVTTSMPRRGRRSATSRARRRCCESAWRRASCPLMMAGAHELAAGDARQSTR